MKSMITTNIVQTNKVRDMAKKTMALREALPKLLEQKELILQTWLSYKAPTKILNIHSIDKEFFIREYADGIFEYFMHVISGEVIIGHCPAIQTFLDYLKDKDIKAGELYEICSHFRRAMIDIGFLKNFASQEYANEVYFIFDKNFRGVLRFYTDTIFQKEQEINRHVKLLTEYKKALDEGALITKTNSLGEITYVNEKFIQLCGYKEEELLGNKHNIMRHPEMTKEFYENLWLEIETTNIFRATIKNYKKNKEYYYVDVTIVKIIDPYDNKTEYMSIGYDVTKLVDARLQALQASQVKDYFLSNMSHEIRTPLNAILGFVSLLMDEDISDKHYNYLNIIQNSGENLLSIINDILDFSKLRSGEFTIEPKVFSLHEELNHTMELFVASASLKNLTITSFICPEIPKELYADPLRIKQILSNFLSNAIKFSPENGVIKVEATCNKGNLKISVKDDGIGIDAENQENIFLAFIQVANNYEKKKEGTGLGLSICNQLVAHMGGKIYVESTLGEGSTFHIEIPVEVLDAQSMVFDEMLPFKDMKIVLYQKKQKTSFQYESFLQYADMFDMNVKTVENLDEPFDIALFVHENIDKNSKKMIKAKKDKKFIAMMSHLYDDYEHYPHIKPMCFPLYCSKIRNVFSSFLEPENKRIFTQKKRQIFQGHILVAEDNEANQELIKILLTKYNLTYDIARNGLEAFMFYKQNNYNLILMDEQMPIMDGNEAVAKILAFEKENNLPHTPVSAITANVIKGAKERGLLSGYDNFLGKPIIIKELERVLDKFLMQSSIVCEDILPPQNQEFKNIEVEKLCQELMLDYEELQLLFRVYKKKMDSLFIELKEKINKKDYTQIALLAHSIKGSSGNFRLEKLQKIADTMEEAAKSKETQFNYEKTLKEMWEIIQKIAIV